MHEKGNEMIRASMNCCTEYWSSQVFRSKDLLQFLQSIIFWCQSLTLSLSLGLSPAPEIYKQWDFEALEENETSNIIDREKKEKDSGMSFSQTTLIPAKE